MKTMRTRLLYVLVSFTIGHLLMGASPLAAQDDCKAILDAESKLDNTPAHAYATMKIGGKTTSGETIYAAGSIYAKINGKWIVTESIKDEEQLKQENGKYILDTREHRAYAFSYEAATNSPRGHRLLL